MEAGHQHQHQRQRLADRQGRTQNHPDRWALVDRCWVVEGFRLGSTRSLRRYRLQDDFVSNRPKDDMSNVLWWYGGGGGIPAPTPPAPC